MKKIKNKLRNTLLLLLLFFLIYIALTIYIFNTNYSFDIKLLILLLLAVIFLVFVFIIKPKLEYYTQLLKYSRLKEDTKGPKMLKESPFSHNVTNMLISDGYKLGYNYDDVETYYKVLQTKDDKIAKYGLLQAFIFIADNISYTDSKISNVINRIEDSVSKKDKFINYSIVVLKSANKLNSNLIKKATTNVRFDKYHKTNVIVIPTIYSRKTKEFFYLSSQKNFPNKYYQFTQQQINKYFK